MPEISSQETNLHDHVNAKRSLISLPSHHQYAYLLQQNNLTHTLSPFMKIMSPLHEDNAIHRSKCSTLCL
jgi:hypothetical protein